MTQFRRLSTLFTLCLLAFATQTAGAAGTNIPQDSIDIREGGTDYKVTFSLTAGDLVHFGNGVDCGSGHKTSPPTGAGRFYDHCHVNYTLDKTGTDEMGNTRTVTAPKIKAYYNSKYSGYTPSGSEDVRTNCHAHAFGKSTWIQDPSYIDADEYTAASGWSDVEVLRGEGVVHSIKVTSSTEGSIGYTVKTSEKNGPSRVYSATWGYSSPPGSNVKLKKK
ncbi:MAG: hypothetical protein R3C99_24490 [Pirellulaceae bacterium]